MHTFSHGLKVFESEIPFHNCFVFIWNLSRGHKGKIVDMTKIRIALNIHKKNSDFTDVRTCYQDLNFQYNRQFLQIFFENKANWKNYWYCLSIKLIK